MNEKNNLNEWLAHCEALHPKGALGIELGLERVKEVAERMQLTFSCPVITVAGTNGKGSSCAMLEAILGQAGYKTGVYGSPHIVHFEERCRIAGQVIAADSLPVHFAAVESAREGLSLTYFEFTTLAILHFMSQAKLDVAILEVGMGGRLDAVNIIDADCAIITNIDLDHIEFLGDNRESIGFEKAGVMRAGKPVIVSDPMPPASLQKYADSIGADMWLIGRDFHFSGDKQQWLWRTAPQRSAKSYAGMAYPALRGANQLLNASGVLAALTAITALLPVSAQAVRNGLALVELPGRFQVIAGQPVLVLDVAHNLHSVSALAQNLDAMGFYPQTHAVFGAMADKDIAAMLGKMDALIDVWHFCDLASPRAAKASDLLELWKNTTKRSDAKAYTYAEVKAGLEAALEAASSPDRITAFGSFYTVGGILQNGLVRTPSKH